MLIGSIELWLAGMLDRVELENSCLWYSSSFNNCTLKMGYRSMVVCTYDFWVNPNPWFWANCEISTKIGHTNNSSFIFIPLKVKEGRGDLKGGWTPCIWLICVGTLCWEKFCCFLHFINFITESIIKLNDFELTLIYWC